MNMYQNDNNQMEDNQIRVLQVVGRLGSGGIEKLLVSLQQNMNPQVIRFDYLVWNCNKKGFYDDLVSNLGSRIISLGMNDTSNSILRAVKKTYYFLRYVNKTDYSIIHLHGSRPIVYVYAFLARISGIENVIIHSHSTAYVPPDFSTKIMPFFKVLFRRYPTLYIACSNAASDYMFPKGITNKIILDNGINFEEYRFSSQTRESIRNQLNIENQFVIGHIGRFTSQKNHHFLIDLFYELQKRVRNSILLLIGEGNLEPSIRRKVESYNLNDKVIFYGITKDVPSLLMCMDMMCFPSLWEGQGIVAIEAQAASLHIVVSDSVPDEVAFSRYYHKVKLSSGIDSWVKECEEIRHSVIRENRSSQIYCEKYDIKRAAERLTNLYKPMKV